MNEDIKRKQSFLLRLPISVREEATQTAQEEGTSLNHFISLAVAEKLSRMKMEIARNEAHPRPLHHPSGRPFLRM